MATTRRLSRRAQPRAYKCKGVGLACPSSRSPSLRYFAFFADLAWASPAPGGQPAPCGGPGASTRGLQSPYGLARRLQARRAKRARRDNALAPAAGVPSAGCSAWRPSAPRATRRRRRSTSNTYVTVLRSRGATRVDPKMFSAAMLCCKPF